MYEHLAKLAEKIGYQMHRCAVDPQEDSSDLTGEEIAAAIRAEGLRLTEEIEIPAERLKILE
jgi:hypothetical protein